MKDARKEGLEESGLAEGILLSASWGRGCGKGRGEVVPYKPSALETFWTGKGDLSVFLKFSFKLL